MLDAMVAVLDVIPNFWSMGMAIGTPWLGILHGFRAADGWFMLQVLRPHQWSDLAGRSSAPMGRRRRFATPQGWLDHLDDVIRPAIEERAGSKTSARPCRTQRGRTGGRTQPT